MGSKNRSSRQPLALPIKFSVNTAATETYPRTHTQLYFRLRHQQRRIRIAARKSSQRHTSANSLWSSRKKQKYFLARVQPLKIIETYLCLRFYSRLSKNAESQVK